MRKNAKLVDHVEKMIGDDTVLTTSRNSFLNKHVPELQPQGQSTKAAYFLAWLARYGEIGTMVEDLRDPGPNGVQEGSVNGTLHDPNSAHSVFLRCNPDELRAYVLRNGGRDSGVHSHLKPAIHQVMVLGKPPMSKADVQLWWEGRRRGRLE